MYEGCKNNIKLGYVRSSFKKKVVLHDKALNAIVCIGTEIL